MDAQLTDDQRKLVEWSKAGSPLKATASRLGMTEEDAAAELARLMHVEHPELTTAAALEMERLDTLRRGIWGKAVAGDTAAVDRALAISNRRQEVVEEDMAQQRPNLTPAQQLQRDMNELVRRTVRRGNASESQGDTAIENTPNQED